VAGAAVLIRQELTPEITSSAYFGGWCNMAGSRQNNSVIFLNQVGLLPWCV
jgi:hypothetical protein